MRRKPKPTYEYVAPPPFVGVPGDYEPCKTSRWGLVMTAFCSECGYSFMAHDKDNICRMPRKPVVNEPRQGEQGVV
jgi:hypothetical protein